MVDLTVDDNNEQKGMKTLTATLFPTKNYIKKTEETAKIPLLFTKNQYNGRNAEDRQFNPHNPVNTLFGVQQRV